VTVGNTWREFFGFSTPQCDSILSRATPGGFRGDGCHDGAAIIQGRLRMVATGRNGRRN
jgi:hypothetical protein